MAASHISALHDCVLLLFEKLNQMVEQNNVLQQQITQLERTTIKRFSDLDGTSMQLVRLCDLEVMQQQISQLKTTTTQHFSDLDKKTDQLVRLLDLSVQKQQIVHLENTVVQKISDLETTMVKRLGELETKTIQRNASILELLDFDVLKQQITLLETTALQRFSELQRSTSQRFSELDASVSSFTTQRQRHAFAQASTSHRTSAVTVSAVALTLNGETMPRLHPADSRAAGCSRAPSVGSSPHFTRGSAKRLQMQPPAFLTPVERDGSRKRPGRHSPEDTESEASRSASVESSVLAEAKKARRELEGSFVDDPVEVEFDQRSRYADGGSEAKPLIQNLLTVNDSVSRSLIMVIGGLHYATVWRSVEVYDPRDNKWIGSKRSTTKSFPSMTKARMSPGVAVLDGMLFAVGGENDSGKWRKKGRTESQVFRSVEKYVNDEWSSSSVPSLPFKRSAFGTAVLNNRIYVIGGCDGNVVVKTMVRYDPLLNHWTSLADMNVARKRIVALALNGLIYVLGGNDGTPDTANSGRLDLVERYDPQTNQWETLGPMMHEREDFAGCVLNEQLYIVGGLDNNKDHLSSCERLDPVTGKWISLANLSTARFGAGLAVFENRIFVFGGHDGQRSLKSVEIYDPDTDSWSFGADMRIPRYLCAADVVPFE